MFEVSVEERGDRTVVACSGEIDLMTAAEFRTTLTDLIVEGRVHLVIDLLGVTFVDSSGLGVLVAARRRARTVKGSLSLVATHPTVLRVLHVTALDRVFPIHETLEEALAADPTVETATPVEQPVEERIEARVAVPEAG